ncbi:hypothetical protein GXW82_14245 [Streptacidiphilus sp. 4-A2]|nr:hypothetical protein [Streptacidiphilus sp. 4-A2]
MPAHLLVLTSRHENGKDPDDPHQDRRSRGRRCVALTAALALAGPAQASVAGGSYVALGDSYTAVGTLTDPAPGTPALCLQDVDNYPHNVARSLGLQLDDASCAGAETSDMTTAQSSDSPAQFDALTPSTSVVTLGIGGNDNNTFITAVAGCEAIDALDGFNIGSRARPSTGRPSPTPSPRTRRTSPGPSSRSTSSRRRPRSSSSATRTSCRRAATAGRS